MSLYNTGIDAYMYTISSESASILHDILWAVSGMVSGNGFTSLAALGMTIGVLLVVMKGVMSQRLDFTPLLWGLVVFVSMFGSSAKLHIVSQEDGNTPLYTVANAPLGIALPATVISSITHYVNEQVTVNFSSTSLNPIAVGENGQIVHKLGSVLEFRKAISNSYVSPGNSDVDGNGNLTRSVTSYFQTCLLEDETITIDSILKSTSPLQAIKSQWGMPTVHVDINGYTPGVYNCIEAGEIISNAINNDKFFETLLKDSEVLNGTSRDGSKEAISNYIQSLLGSYEDSLRFMQNLYIYENLSLSAEMKDSYQGTAMSKMLADAREKRLATSAADEQLFQGIIWKTSSFLEALIYALFPLTVFAIMLGGPGIKVMTSYFILILWMGLWSTGTVLVQYIVESGISTSISQLAVNGSVSGSISTQMLFNSPMGVPEIYKEISRWYSTGAEMMVSVPLIMMALVTGSMFTLSSVAKSLSSSNSDVDASEIAPTTGKKSFGNASVTTSVDGNGNAYVGTEKKGIDDVNNNTEISYGKSDAISAEQSVTSARGKSVAAEKAFSSAIEDTSSVVQSNMTSSTEALQSGSSEQQKLGKGIQLSRDMANENRISSSDSSSFEKFIRSGIDAKQINQFLGAAKDVNKSGDKKSQKEFISKMKGAGVAGLGLQVLSTVATQGTKGAAKMLSAINAQAGLKGQQSLSIDEMESSAQKISENENLSQAFDAVKNEAFSYTENESGSKTMQSGVSSKLADAFSQKESASKELKIAESRKSQVQSGMNSNAKVNLGNLLNAVIGNNENRASASRSDELNLGKEDRQRFLKDNDFARNTIQDLASNGDKGALFNFASSFGMTSGTSYKEDDDMKFDDSYKKGEQEVAESDKGVKQFGTGLTSRARERESNIDGYISANQPNGKDSDGSSKVDNRYANSSSEAKGKEMSFGEKFVQNFKNEQAEKSSEAMDFFKQTKKSEMPMLAQAMISDSDKMSAMHGANVIMGMNPGNAQFDAYDSGRQKLASLVDSFQSGNISEEKFTSLGGSQAAVNAYNGKEMDLSSIKEVAISLASMNSGNSQDFISDNGLNVSLQSSRQGFENIRNSVNGDSNIQAIEDLVSAKTLASGAGSLAGSAAESVADSWNQYNSSVSKGTILNDTWANLNDVGEWMIDKGSDLAGATVDGFNSGYSGNNQKIMIPN